MTKTNTTGTRQKTKLSGFLTINGKSASLRRRPGSLYRNILSHIVHLQESSSSAIRRESKKPCVRRTGMWTLKFDNPNEDKRDAKLSNPEPFLSKRLHSVELAQIQIPGHQRRKHAKNAEAWTMTPSVRNSKFPPTRS